MTSRPRSVSTSFAKSVRRRRRPLAGATDQVEQRRGLALERFLGGGARARRRHPERCLETPQLHRGLLRADHTALARLLDGAPLGGLVAVGAVGAPAAVWVRPGCRRLGPQQLVELRGLLLARVLLRPEPLELLADRPLPAGLTGAARALARPRSGSGRGTLGELLALGFLRGQRLDHGLIRVDEAGPLRRHGSLEPVPLRRLSLDAGMGLPHPRAPLLVDRLQALLALHLAGAQSLRRRQRRALLRADGGDGDQRQQRKQGQSEGSRESAHHTDDDTGAGSRPGRETWETQLLAKPTSGATVLKAATTKAMWASRSTPSSSAPR